MGGAGARRLVGGALAVVLVGGALVVILVGGAFTAESLYSGWRLSWKWVEPGRQTSGWSLR